MFSNSIQGHGMPMAALATLTFLSTLATALPSPWMETDIGQVGVPGSAAESGGNWAFYGSGDDIWNNADAFHFAYQRLNGNTQVVARVMGVVNTHEWAKAGVMIREDLNPGSRHAFVCLTPSNGVAFQSRSVPGGTSFNVNVTGLYSPRWVKLARSGDIFTASHSADGVNWTQIGSSRLIGMQPVVYVGLASTSHDNSRLGNAGFQDVRFLPPPLLFVTGSTLLNAGDAAAKRRMEILGYGVTVKSATAATAADAIGKDLVVISSTVFSGDVGSKFSSVCVPVVTWENALLDDLGMTGTVGGADYGVTGNQLGLGVFSAACDRATMYTAARGWEDGCSDLAAGLTGTFDVTRQGNPVSWGRPGANAVRIAYPYGNPAVSSVFAYEKGASMPGRSAPARRVFLYMGDNSAEAWTGRGQSLFDAAIRWASQTRYSITKNVLIINYDPILEGHEGLRMHEWGLNRTGWWGGDPVTLAKNHLADLTESSGGYVRWRVVFHPGVPAYIDRWAPITGPVQFDSPSFSEQDFLDAYQYALDTWDWGGAARRMPNGGAYQLDYHRILDDFGVDAMVNAGEVDEVIVAAHPYSGSWESAMAGPAPYPVNGGIYPRATGKNFFVMGLSYERGLSEALENFGHRAEWMVSRTFHGYQNTITYDRCFYPDWNRENESPPPCGGSRQIPYLSNLYDKFVVVEGILPGEAAVGAAHWAPNALARSDEYVWSKDNPVYSMSDDWLFNYPNLLGNSTKRQVSVYEWLPMAQDDEAGRGFKKWWFLHMPRVPGLYRDPNVPMNDRKLNNWWEYLVNFNRHPESDN